MTQYAIVIKHTNSGFTAKTPNHTYKEARDYALNPVDQARLVAIKFLEVNGFVKHKISGFGTLSNNGEYVATVDFA